MKGLKGETNVQFDVKGVEVIKDGRGEGLTYIRLLVIHCKEEVVIHCKETVQQLGEAGVSGSKQVEKMKCLFGTC